MISHCTPPPAPRNLACQHDSERWFDRRHRRDALMHCLTCPARTWCAGQALQARASHGMWAGVWIDGSHNEAAHRLRAIANATPSPSDDGSQAASSTIPAPPAPPPPLPSRAATPIRARSARAAVLARSSGHCEVLGEHCRYTSDQMLTRRGDPTIPLETLSCAELFAACRACAEQLAALDPQSALRSGYLIASGRDPAEVPFQWRQTRWVLLDRHGRLSEVGSQARTA